MPRSATAGRKASRRERKYLALLSGDDQHEPAELITALDRPRGRRRRLRPGLALDARAAGSWARSATAASARALYSVVFCVLVLPPRHATPRTASGSSGPTSSATRRSTSTRTGSRATTWSRTSCTRRSGAGYKVIEVPVHRPLPREGGLHEDARPQGLVAPLPAGDPAARRGEAMTEPRMTDQVARAFSGRRVLVTGGAGFVGGSLDPSAGRGRRPGDRPRRPVHRPARDRPDERPARQGIGRRRGARPRARRATRRSSSTWRPGTSSPSTKNPRDDFATNIGGTLNVLLAARDSKVDRVVYTGSTSIYGNPRSIPINEDDPAVVRCRRTRSASSAASTTASRSTRATGSRSRSSATRTSSGSASDRTTRTAASSASSSPPRSTASRSRSTATASRPATSPTSTTRSTRPSWPRSGPAPRARSSTSAPGSRRRSTGSP